MDTDELPGKIEALNWDFEDRINPETNSAFQQIGEEESKLSAMDGGAVATETAEKMEQKLAKIQRLADRYVSLKVASKQLQREI